MSTAPVITVNTSLVEALLARTKKKVRPGILMSVVLEKAKRVVHDNFQALNVLRNRYGSNFYEKWADDSAVTPLVLNGGSKGKLELIDEKGALRHKIFGGSVTPKRVKFLTIPISEQAKFQSARGSNAAHGEIPGLFLVRGNNRRGLFLAHGKQREFGRALFAQEIRYSQTASGSFALRIPICTRRAIRLR